LSENGVLIQAGAISIYPTGLSQVATQSYGVVARSTIGAPDAQVSQAPVMFLQTLQSVPQAKQLLLPSLYSPELQVVSVMQEVPVSCCPVGQTHFLVVELSS